MATTLSSHWRAIRRNIWPTRPNPLMPTASSAIMLTTWKLGFQDFPSLTIVYLQTNTIYICSNCLFYWKMLIRCFLKNVLKLSSVLTEGVMPGHWLSLALNHCCISGKGSFARNHLLIFHPAIHHLATCTCTCFFHHLHHHL